MHVAVKNQTNPAKLFNTLPWAIGFKHAAEQGYVVIAASNIVIKVVVDPATGLPSVQNDPTDPTKLLQLKVGKNPRGIVINSSDTRAYVMNYVSRDITVLDLDGNERVLDTKLSANLPTPGTLADIIQVAQGAVQHFGRSVLSPARQLDSHYRTYVATRMGRLLNMSSLRAYGRCRLDLPLGTKARDSSAHRFRSHRSHTS